MPLSYLVAFLLALFVWQVPFVQVLAASVNGLIVTLTLLYIIFGAILLLNAAGERRHPDDPAGLHRHHAGPAAPRNRGTGAFPVCGDGPQYRNAQPSGGRRHGLGGGAFRHAGHQRC